MRKTSITKAFLLLTILSISLILTKSTGQNFSANTNKYSAQLLAATPGTPLKVAIECANGSSARNVEGNDPVYSMQDLFESKGWTVTIVNGSSIDTVQELSEYNVVVVGDSGHSDSDFSVFQAALKEWVQTGGGGVVATGWTIFEMTPDEELDQLLPVSPDYDFAWLSGNITMISGINNPVAHGVDPFPVYEYAEFPESHVADPGATVLGFVVSEGYENVTSPASAIPVVVSWSFGLGRAIYLGPIYFADFQSYANEGYYTDVDAVRLLLNSVEYAAGRTPASIVAECVILSNEYADTCALDFTLKIPDVDFSWMNVEAITPTISYLSAFNVVLLFEDGTFANAPNVGSAIYQYVMAGGNLVIGTFYEQERSDCGGDSWGPLEAIDPFTSDGYGCEYIGDVLNVSTLVPHPITFGFQNLTVGNSGYRGGVSAKPGTIVVANWTRPNALGEDCPLAGYSILENGQRLVQLSIYPNYVHVSYGAGDFTGDYHLLWSNSLKWAAMKAGTAISSQLNATAVTLGSPVTISGTLSATYGVGLGSKNVLIQYSTDNTIWNTVTSTSTGSNGAYSCSWTPPATGTIFIRTAWTGDAIYTGATAASDELSVKESSTITCQPSATSIAKGASITISGTIAPNRTGALVTVHCRLSGAATWDVLVSATAGSTSSYEATISPWAPSASGTYEIKASWEGDENTLAAESSVQTIAVTATVDYVPYVIGAVLGLVIGALAASAVFLARGKKQPPPPP